jgi:hypothetical protein
VFTCILICIKSNLHNTSAIVLWGDGRHTDVKNGVSLIVKILGLCYFALCVFTTGYNYRVETEFKLNVSK